MGHTSTQGHSAQGHGNAPKARRGSDRPGAWQSEAGRQPRHQNFVRQGNMAFLKELLAGTAQNPHTLPQVFLLELVPPGAHGLESIASKLRPVFFGHL